MIPDLIFDVGMHRALDTEFYLRKGFRVIAFEANPYLCDNARIALKPYVDTCRLVIMNYGIADEERVADFIINRDKDDWSSFDPSFGNRTPNTELVRVQCLRLDRFIEQFGCPYYLKVDIEGYDHLAIDTLERQKQLPKYVSVEATVKDFPARVEKLGYKKFKLISQVWNQTLAAKLPPCEGVFIEQKFTGHHSGPFGDETYGPWMDASEVAAEFQACLANRYSGSLHERLGCPKDVFEKSWWDFHAALA